MNFLLRGRRWHGMEWNGKSRNGLAQNSVNQSITKRDKTLNKGDKEAFLGIIRKKSYTWSIIYGRYQQSGIFHRLRIN